jgi:uncharacterized protein (DUF58 family)
LLFLKRSRSRVKVRFTSPGLRTVVAAFLLAAIALVKNINLILLVSYFFVGLIIWNYIQCRQAVRRIRINRLPTNPAFAHDEVPCEYEIENLTRKPVANLVLEDSPFGTAHVWTIPTVPAQSRILVTRLATAGQRGRFESMDASVATTAPFGLVRAKRTTDKTVEAWIYPGRGVIDLDRLRLRLPAFGVGRERRRALVPLPAEGTDIHGLRPFRTGDSPRLIHWKTTARVGEPIVREFDRNAAPDLFVMLDVAWIRRDHTGYRLELALEFLSTLIWTWSTKTEAALIVALPDAESVAQHRVSQRAEAHALLRFLATYQLPRAHDAAPVSYDAVSERIPILMIGETQVETRRGLTIDPSNASEIYRPKASK